MTYLCWILREEEGSWEEIELFWKAFLHSGESKGQNILSRDHSHPWKVIDSLQIVHFLQHFVGDSSVTPFDAPIPTFPEILSFPVEFVTGTHLLYDRIFRVCISIALLVKLMVTFIFCGCLCTISLSMLFCFLRLCGSSTERLFRSLLMDRLQRELFS